MNTGPKGILVEGDNLEVLPPLLGAFGGRCALALCDPPYNARNRKDYPDDRDSGEWLGWIRPRLELFRQFLSPTGILACHIDDSEQAPLQVLLDGIFGRERRINTVCVKLSELSGVKMRYQDRLLPRIKEYVLLYGNGPEAALRPSRRRKDPEKLSAYARYYRWFLENPDDPVADWRVVPLREAAIARGIGGDAESLALFREENADRCVYRTNNRWFDTLTESDRPAGRFARMESPWGESYVWWEGRQMLFLSDHVDEPLSDLWTDVSTINLGREGGTPFPSGKKPEVLAERIMELCSAPGDLVLDPFCGSGTVAAVAHKSGRNWLSAELDHGIATRACGRLKRVVSGQDATGISSRTGWPGGGTFEFRSPAAAATDTAAPSGFASLGT